MRRETLAPLTSLRFFAAAAIVALHLRDGFGYTTPDKLATGVVFFFVLSGFILTYVYGDQLRTGADIRGYYCARVARIWPLHLATLVFAALVLPPNGAADGPIAFVANALLLQSWWPSLASAFSFNAVAWTLSDEAFFYVLFPLIVAGRRYFWVIFGSWAAIVAAASIMAASCFSPDLPENIATPSWAAFRLTSPAYQLVTFLLGVGLGFLFLRFPRVKLPVWAWTVLEIASAGLILAALGLIPPLPPPFMVFVSTHLGQIFAQWWGGSFASTLPYGAAVLCFAYRGGLLSRALGWRFLVLLGEISFATYMIHQLILRFWMQQDWAPGPWDPVGLVAILGAIYVGSYVTWRFLERPAQRLVTGLGQRPPDEVPSTAPTSGGDRQ